MSNPRRDGINVQIVRMHRKVYEALERGGIVEALGPDTFVENPYDVLPGPK